MTSSKKNTVCISCDLKLHDSQWDILWPVLREKFPEAKFAEIKLKQMDSPDYKLQKSNWSSVVILFGGYNIKRYYSNCWRHLICFKGPIYGLNVEGRLFNLPRLYSIQSILRFELNKLALKILAKITFRLFINKSKSGDTK